MSRHERSWQDPALIDRLEPLLDLLHSSHVSLSSITEKGRAQKVHLTDSLSGLAVDEVANARRVVDLGAGAGFPGIPLALALPDTKFTLIDSVGRKVEFMNQAAGVLGLENAIAIKTRSEDWARAEGRESCDLVTARAVAPLEALAELASPLLTEGGSLVAWKGDREYESERTLGALSSRLAMELDRIETVVPYSGSRERNLYVLRKNGPTPEFLPRRAGMVRKRPLSL